MVSLDHAFIRNGVHELLFLTDRNQSFTIPPTNLRDRVRESFYPRAAFVRENPYPCLLESLELKGPFHAVALGREAPAALGLQEGSERGAEGCGV